MKAKRSGSVPLRVLCYLLLIVLAFICIVPFYNIFINVAPGDFVDYLTNKQYHFNC